MSRRGLESSPGGSETAVLPMTGRAARDRDALFGGGAGASSLPPTPTVDGGKRPRPGHRSPARLPSNGSADGRLDRATSSAAARTPSAGSTATEPRETGSRRVRTSTDERRLVAAASGQLGSSPGPEPTPAQDVAQLRRQATDAALRGRQSSRRALQLAREARAIGVDVTIKLGEQDEQLDRVQNDLDEIHGHLTHSDEIIHDMQSFWKKLWPWARDRNRRHERYAPALGDGAHASAATQRDIEALQRQREDGTLNRRDRAATSSMDELGGASSERTGAAAGTVPAHALLEDAVEAEATAPAERRRGLLSALSRVTRRARGLDDAEERQARERSALLSAGAGTLAATEGAAAADRGDGSLAATAADPWEEHVRAQDRDLDELSVVVSDLRTLAVGIGEQVREQSGKIEVISKDVDYGRERIHENNRRIRRML
jgi:hypothetical protein